MNPPLKTTPQPRNLKDLPKSKQTELKILKKLIKDIVKVEMVILFGSYARGDFVDKDIHQVGHVTYEYRSDFDILIIVQEEKVANNINMWHTLESKITKSDISTPVNFIVETIKDVNENIQLGRYFFVDIKKEGIILHNSDLYSLAQAKNISKEKKIEMWEEDFDFWIKNAKDYEDGFKFYFDKGLKQNLQISLNKATFNLHQKVECLFTAFALVFTDYRPKYHDIQKFLEYCHPYDETLQAIFPRTKEEDKECFRLFRNAYVDARYKKHYVITKEQLEFLEVCVGRLEEVIRGRCEEKILGY